MRTNRFLSVEDGASFAKGRETRRSAYLPDRVERGSSLHSQNDNSLSTDPVIESAEEENVAGFKSLALSMSAHGRASVDDENSAFETSSPEDSSPEISLSDNSDLVVSTISVDRLTEETTAASSEDIAQKPLVTSERLIEGRRKLTETFENLSREKAKSVSIGKINRLNPTQFDDNYEFSNAYVAVQPADFAMYSASDDLLYAEQVPEKKSKRNIWKEIIYSAGISTVLIFILLGVRMISHDGAVEQVEFVRSAATDFVRQVHQTIGLSSVASPDSPIQVNSNIAAPNVEVTLPLPDQQDRVSSLPTKSAESSQNSQQELQVPADVAGSPDVFNRINPSKSAMPVNAMEDALSKLGSTQCIERANQIVSRLSLTNFATLLQKPNGPVDNSLLVAALVPKDNISSDSLAFVSVAPGQQKNCDGQYQAISVVDKPCSTAITELFGNSPIIKVGTRGVTLAGLTEFARVFALPVSNSCVFIRQELVR